MQQPHTITGVALPVTANDRLRVRLWTTSASGLTAFVRALLMTPDGELVECVERLPATRANSPQTKTVNLTNGYLLAASVFIPSGYIYDALAFADVKLQYGSNAADDELQHLISGSVSLAKGITFPFEPSHDNTDVWSIDYTESQSNPAVGSDISIAVPTGQILELSSLNFTFTTDATAANRRIKLQIYDDGHLIWEARSRTDHPASTSVRYYCTPASVLPSDDITNGLAYLPIPPGLRSQAFEFYTSTTNKQAGDDYSAVTLGSRRTVDVA